MKLGANAKYLKLAWEKPAAVDIGLTGYNWNVFWLNKGVWDQSLADDVNGLVKAAGTKCGHRSLFFG